MKKSFTWLFGLFVLMFGLGASSAFGQTFVPDDDASNVDKTDEVSVTFSADVTKGDGYVRFYEDAATDVPLFVELVSDSRIVVSGKKVVFQFNSLMADSKDYYVTWDAGAFKLGTANVPALAMGGWNWTTGDYTAPVLDVKSDGSHFDPENSETNVVTTIGTLSLLFKEDVNPTSGDEHVYLMKDNGGTYGDVVEILSGSDLTTNTGNSKQIDIAVSTLEENTTYYVMIEEGAIVDDSGNDNPFAGFMDKTTWSFTTKDESAPVMTITKNEVTKAKVAWDVEFSEKGKLYYVVVAKGADAPTSAQVKAGANYGAVTVVATGTLSYDAAGTKIAEKDLANTVQGGTEYDYYFVSETYINVDGVSETLLSPPVMKEVQMVDNVKPEVTVYDPLDNASGVAKDKKLKLTFNEYIMLGTGNVTVKKVVDNSTFATLDIAGATVSDDTMSVTIDLPENFASLASYYVMIPSGVITDLAGNAYAGITSTTTWNFTAEDYAAPTFTFTPANGSTSTTAATLNGAGGIKITFNEPILFRDGSAIVDDEDLENKGLNQALILKEDGDEVAMNYAVTGGVITVTKEVGTFEADTEYSLTFLGWYVADGDGNIIQNSSTLVFSTADNVIPTVENIKPDDVEATSNITINFSEPIRLTNDTELSDTNVDGVIVSFLEAGTTPIAFDATVSADKTQIIIDPAVDLKSSVTYNITLTSGLEDYSGNAIGAGDLDQSFTVVDFVKPVATLTPADGTTTVSAGTLSGSVVFSEDVTKVTDGGAPDMSVLTLREGSATGTVIPVSTVVYTIGTKTLSFEATVAAAKTYYLTVAAALEDAAGNVNDAKTSMFSTLSSAAPTIALDDDDEKIVTPLEGATGVTSSAAITVTFADPIKAIIDENSIVITDDALATNVVADVTGSSLSADGKTLTILHDALPANTLLYVTLKVGAVQSQTGTAQGGNLAWSFYSEDTVAPSAPTLSPVNGASGVAIASTGTGATELILTFANTDDLHIGTGDVKIRLVTGDAIVQTLGVANISVSSDADDDTNEIVTVELNADLDYATDYYVQVSPTLILDAEDNAYAGISAKTGWAFTTQDAPDFEIDFENCNPTQWQDSVLETEPLIVRFNHDVASFDNTQEIVLDEVTFTAGSPYTIVAGDNVFALPPNDPAFTWAGNQLTIDYVVGLKPNTAYRLTLYANLAKDVYGNDFVGASYVFFTSSRQGPMASFSPADEDEDVAKGTDIVITFDEPFFKSDGETAYTPVELQGDHSIINVGGTVSGGDLDYVATIDGMTITLDLDADLESSEDVTITVGAGKFYDAGGNMYDADMNGLGDVQTATFTVEDYEAPTASVAVTDGPSGTAFKYTVESDEDGMVYSLVLGDSATDPTKEEVMAGTATAVDAGDASDEIAVTGLTPSTDYNVWYFGVDESGNEQDLASEAVSTIDDVAPVLEEMLPEDGAATDDDIALVFDEEMASTVSGAVLLKDKATGTILESFDVGDATFSGDGKTISFTPSVLESSTTYVVEIDAGTFEDASANAYDSFITFEFTTADEIAPTVDLTTPDNTDSEYEVEEATGLVLTFSEAVQAGDTNIEVYEDVDESGTVTTGDILVQLIDPATMTASDDNETRTFDITAPLSQDESYLIVISAGSFMDMAENDVVAYLGRIDIVDTSAPVASHTYSPVVPDEDDVDVAVSNNIIITFDEAIYWSINPVTGYLYNDNVDSLVTLTGPNGAVDFDATISADAKTITINPTNNLMSLSTYVVTVSQVEDASGNLMDTYSFSFTTREEDPPMAMFNPAHDTEDVSAVGPFTITFDKNVYVYVDLVGNLPILAPLTSENVADYVTLVTGDDISGGTDVDFTATVTDGKVVTITPDEELDASGADIYTYGIIEGQSLRDDLGNALTGTAIADAADSTYATVTVQDLTAPSVVTPTVDNKMPKGGTDVDGAMWMVFDEDIAIGTGNLYIRRVVDGELMQTIAANETNLTVSEDTVFIQHADFALNTHYYVVIDEGFVTDLSGNKYAGIADDQVGYDPTDAPDAWNFNTSDTDTPMLVAQSPAPGTVDVLVGQSMKLTFNKGVQAGSGWIVIYKADGTPFQIISVTDAANVVFNQYAADTVVTINHMPFDAETEYFVRVDAGAITDGTNEWDGIADESWNFTTEDITEPSIDELNPEDDATDVVINKVFEMTFDRNVAKGSGNIKIYDRTGETLVESLPVSSDAVVITDNMVSFQFSMLLDTMAEYYIIVEPGAITNASVNAIPFAGITTALEWNFATSDSIPVDVPTIASLSPNMETIADNHPLLVMTFVNDVMYGEAGNLYVTEKDSATATLTIPITAEMVTGNEVKVTYDWEVVGSLDTSKTYFVTVDPGVFVSSDDVAFAGISSETTWTFTTGPVVATATDPEIELVDFKVYPNPFNNQLMIDNNEKLTRVVVVNIAGQRVMDMEYPSHVINTSHLVSGVYVVSMFTESGIAKTERVIKR